MEEGQNIFRFWSYLYMILLLNDICTLKEQPVQNSCEMFFSTKNILVCQLWNSTDSAMEYGCCGVQEKDLYPVIYRVSQKNALSELPSMSMWWSGVDHRMLIDSESAFFRTLCSLSWTEIKHFRMNPKISLRRWIRRSPWEDEKRPSPKSWVMF